MIKLIMRLSYSDHAKKRMRQRGITLLEVQYILRYPQYTKRSSDGRTEVVGRVRNRTTKVVLIVKKPKFIKVITVV